MDARRASMSTCARPVMKTLRVSIIIIIIVTTIMRISARPAQPGCGVKGNVTRILTPNNTSLNAANFPQNHTSTFTSNQTSFTSDHVPTFTPNHTSTLAVNHTPFMSNHTSFTSNYTSLTSDHAPTFTPNHTSTLAVNHTPFTSNHTSTSMSDHTSFSSNETSASPFMMVLPVGSSDVPPQSGVRLSYTKECPLATCAVTNLGSALQHGDEKAGQSTGDPDGFGKK